MLVIGSAAGGTVAWLIGQSTPLLNTFTPSGIGVMIAESPTDDGDSDPNTNTYSMLPGATISKDPIVTVAAYSEDAWVFVQLKKSSNFDAFLSFDIADGWTALEGVDGVYWRTTQKSETAQAFSVLKDNAVIVKPEVTAAMLNALTEATRPTLAATAYAVQQQSIATPLEAWALIEEQSSTP